MKAVELNGALCAFVKENYIVKFTNASELSVTCRVKDIEQTLLPGFNNSVLWRFLTRFPKQQDAIPLVCWVESDKKFKLFYHLRVSLALDVTDDIVTETSMVFNSTLQRSHLINTVFKSLTELFDEHPATE